MPFIPVKCPSCGGNIELDDQRETGFCMYCGTKVLYKEAVQKMVLSGEVSVSGIANIDKLLQNAETFVKLREYKKAVNVLLDVTDSYPEDYRGWWQLASMALHCPFESIPENFDYSFRQNIQIGSFDEIINKFIGCKYGIFWYNPCFKNEYSEYSLFGYAKDYRPVRFIRNAISVAPLEKATNIKRETNKWLLTYTQFYSIALQYLLEDMKMLNEFYACQRRATERYSQNNKKRFFRENLTTNDFLDQELKLSGIDTSINASGDPGIHININYFAYKFVAGGAIDVCLDNHYYIETCLRSGLAELLELTREFDV